MHFDWNEQTLGWMLDASEYTGYNRNLAELLLRHIGKDETVCDMGSGLGLVDFELAKAVKSISCVDISAFAVNYINSRAAAVEGNISAECCDGAKYEGSWDTVLALFHASAKIACENYLKKARKRVILLTHDVPKDLKLNEFMIKKCSNVESTAEWMDEHGYHYSVERCALEFGQPHRSFDEALDYTRVFSNKVSEEALLAHTKEIVQDTGRSDFPLYTPKLRHFGLFIIEA